MNKEQYQTQVEEVVNDLREFYVFLERTEFLESLVELQRGSMLNQAKVDAEGMGNADEAKSFLKFTLVKVMGMSDEEVMESFMAKLQERFAKSGKEFLNDFLN